MDKETIPLSQAAYEFAIVLFVLAAGYALLSLTFSYSSGWQKLRSSHGVNQVKLVESWSFQSALFDTGYGFQGLLGRYRRCLNFGYTAEGIYLSGMVPFLWFHRPILIPWKDAVVTWMDGYSLYSLSVPTVSISIPKKVYDGLLASQLVENTNSLLAT